MRWPLTHSLALTLTPVHLLVTTAIVLSLHPVMTRRFFIFCISAFVLAYGAEVWGVNSGVLFGTYTYGTVLGPGWMGTPIMIGITWLLLIYLFGQAIEGLARPAWVKAILIGVLMTGFDTMIEPVAMKLGFWHWPGGQVDAQNYLGWFVCATAIGYVYERLVSGRNPVAVWVLVMNVLFFLGLRF